MYNCSCLGVADSDNGAYEDCPIVKSWAGFQHVRITVTQHSQGGVVPSGTFNTIHLFMYAMLIACNSNTLFPVDLSPAMSCRRVKASNPTPPELLLTL